ncbi:MAG: ATP-binding protein [Armatimonadetes bacterium]|nr:ATP-binding protein [Armatimonadota bacterium]
MRSELVTKLLESFASGDRETFLRWAEEGIKEEAQQRHQLVAERWRSILNGRSSLAPSAARGIAPVIPRDNEKGFKLLQVSKPDVLWNDVILDQQLDDALRLLAEEHRKHGLLESYGLKPKRKLLLFGPPGTGKTLTAKALSNELGYPLVYIKFEAVVSSFLGETAANLRKIFDFIEQGEWLVLFDEFDIIGKQRDDPSEHGEIKRVVNNFMLMLENFEGPSMIVAATNHPRLLDIGVWRRFDEALRFELPTEKARALIFAKYLRVMKQSPKLDCARLAHRTAGFSGSDIEQACLHALKTAILAGLDEVGSSHVASAIAVQRTRLAHRKLRSQ